MPGPTFSKDIGNLTGADATGEPIYVKRKIAFGDDGSATDVSSTNPFPVTIAGGVLTVTASSPLFSSGGATPNITIQKATSTQDGYLSAVDWNTFNNKVSVVGAIDSQVASANGLVIVNQNIYAQSASATVPGMVNNTTQSFSGNKTFTGTVAISISSLTALVLNSTSFIFDSTNNALGIGVIPLTNTFLDGLNSTGAAKRVQLTGYGTGSTVGYRGRFARGTPGSPTAAQSGDILNFFSAQGFGANTFPVSSTGAINLVAGETFTNASNQTYQAFLVTPTGSTAAAEAMRVSSTAVTLGPQSSSTAIHAINGGIYKTVRTITANLVIDTTTSDYEIFCNASGPISITLPNPANGTREIKITDISGAATTNNITIVRFGSELIQNLAVSKILQTNYGSFTLNSDLTNWWMS